MEKKENKELRGYKSLCCAVIKQAVEDYWDNIISQKELEDFLHRTAWVQCLDLDIENLLTLAKKKWSIINGQR